MCALSVLTRVLAILVLNRRDDGKKFAQVREGSTALDGKFGRALNLCRSLSPRYHPREWVRYRCKESAGPLLRCRAPAESDQALRRATSLRRPDSVHCASAARRAVQQRGKPLLVSGVVSWQEVTKRRVQIQVSTVCQEHGHPRRCQNLGQRMQGQTA